MWTDHYLKFASRDEYEAVRPPALVELVGVDFVVDEVGVLFRSDTFVQLSGFHVNVRLAAGRPLPLELEAYSVGVPDMPKRVFA